MNDILASLENGPGIRKESGSHCYCYGSQTLFTNQVNRKVM